MSGLSRLPTYVRPFRGVSPDYMVICPIYPDNFLAWNMTICPALVANVRFVADLVGHLSVLPHYMDIFQGDILTQTGHIWQRPLCYP